MRVYLRFFEALQIEPSEQGVRVGEHMAVVWNRFAAPSPPMPPFRSFQRQQIKP